MRYIFPRQYGLHNVFTSKVDPRETAMPLKDYTLREKEIHQSMCRDLGDKVNELDEVAKWKLRMPKRLRGDVAALVNKLRVLNQRCSYVELLRHYCPVEVSLQNKHIKLSADDVDATSFIEAGMEKTWSTAKVYCYSICRRCK